MTTVSDYIASVRVASILHQVLVTLQIPFVVMNGSFGKIFEVHALNMTVFMKLVPSPNDTVLIMITPKGASQSMDITVHKQLLIQKLHNILGGLDADPSLA